MTKQKTIEEFYWTVEDILSAIEDNYDSPDDSVFIERLAKAVEQVSDKEYKSLLRKSIESIVARQMINSFKKI